MKEQDTGGGSWTMNRERERIERAKGGECNWGLGGERERGIDSDVLNVSAVWPHNLLLLSNLH